MSVPDEEYYISILFSITITYDAGLSVPSERIRSVFNKSALTYLYIVYMLDVYGFKIMQLIKTKVNFPQPLVT